MRHGIRHLALGPRGLRLNGRFLRLRGQSLAALDEPAALALRQGGYNLVVVPLGEATRPAWEIADRIGLLVLGRLQGTEAPPEALAAHPCCLGWLAGEQPQATVPPGTFLGVGPGQEEGQFRAVRPGDLAAAGTELPLLVLDAPPGFDSERAVLGVVEGP